MDDIMETFVHLLPQQKLLSLDIVLFAGALKGEGWEVDISTIEGLHKEH